MNNIIFLFGASCSGKSTLGAALQKSLGRGWTYIDRDDLIELEGYQEEVANQVLEERIRLVGSKIIIDAQIPWRKKREGEFYFMVLPPLNVLLERDGRRTEKLGRSLQLARAARQYVVKTFTTLSRMDKKDFNCCFDSSRQSVEEEVRVITSMISSTFDLHMKYFCISIAGVALGVVCVLFLRK